MSVHAVKQALPPGGYVIRRLDEVAVNGYLYVMDKDWPMHVRHFKSESAALNYLSSKGYDVASIRDLGIQILPCPWGDEED